MSLLNQHGTRIAVTLVPVLLVLLHAVGVWPLDLLQRLDNIIHDTRLRATLVHTLEPRIVIVDIDEQSLAEVGRWPWPRGRVAQLVDRLFDEQQIALLGFDTVFAEPDPSATLAELQRLARGALAQQPGFAAAVQTLTPQLDHDARLARALAGRPVVLGYYLTSDRGGRRSGVLPEPVMTPDSLQGRPVLATHWNGFGANIAPLAAAAPQAGFFNAIAAPDGVVRSLPLLAEHGGQFYESLALAMFRRLVGMPTVEPGFPPERLLPTGHAALESVRLVQGDTALDIHVSDRLTALIPFRGPGGPSGGSFRYVSAADVLAGRLAPAELRGKIVLLGTTAPGLLDLRATPVGEVFPGVETHANLLAGLLDGHIRHTPDFALGYEVLVLLASGLLLAWALPLLSAPRAVALTLAVLGAVIGLNSWLYLAHGLVLPLASAMVMIGSAFALNMSHSYWVESRTKRALAQLFGTYVPPGLVSEMVKDPGRYSMVATTRELTVMFCDMRGFTPLAESMQPTQLQALLNTVFSRLTEVIRTHDGTIDKYMGDCVMAFWGAPMTQPDHAARAVAAALDMATAIQTLNREHAVKGLPAIGVGIGLNTGAMCVGDMGSDVRRSYTVIGDAVNLAARLEGLCRVYGVDVIASDATRAQVPEAVWQALDHVRVKGKAVSVSVFTPLARQATDLKPMQIEELRLWKQALQAWRMQNWPSCDGCLAQLQRLNEQKVLYRLYRARLTTQKALPLDLKWDGTTPLTDPVFFGASAMATRIPLTQIGLPGHSAPGAGFEAPFEMLEACHERVERMLVLIRRLQEHLQKTGCDDSARQAATDVMRYFDQAAPRHHEDEERHVFPPLMAGPDAAVKALVLRLIQDHRQMELAWTDARSVLQTVADHGDSPWYGLTVWHQVKLNDFARLYRQHVDDEEQVAYPAARNLLGPGALAAMSEDMMVRRGVLPLAKDLASG